MATFTDRFEHHRGQSPEAPIHEHGREQSLVREPHLEAPRRARRLRSPQRRQLGEDARRELALIGLDLRIEIERALEAVLRGGHALPREVDRRCQEVRARQELDRALLLVDRGQVRRRLRDELQRLLVIQLAELLFRALDQHARLHQRRLAVGLAALRLGCAPGDVSRHERQAPLGRRVEPVLDLRLVDEQTLVGRSDHQEHGLARLRRGAGREQREQQDHRPHLAAPRSSDQARLLPQIVARHLDLLHAGDGHQRGL